MKKRLWIVNLAVAILLTLSIGLSACGGNSSDNGSNGGASHTHSYQWVDNGDGTHKQHCSNSGCNDPDINRGNHDYGTNGVCVCGAVEGGAGHNHNYQWVDNGDGTHKQHCQNSGCDEPDINEGSHNWDGAGVCISCGAEKADFWDAQKLIDDMADYYNNRSLWSLVRLAYDGNGADIMYESLSANGEEAYFEGYENMKVVSVDCIYFDGVDASFSVTVTVVGKVTTGDNTTKENYTLTGTINTVKRNSSWYLTELPQINLAGKTISTRENDGAELYFGSDFYTTVPVIVEKNTYGEITAIIVPINSYSSQFSVSGFFKPYGSTTEVVPMYRANGVDQRMSSYNKSLMSNYTFHLDIYEDSSYAVREYTLKFLEKSDITVQFYNYDGSETAADTQTFMQYKKATEPTPYPSAIPSDCKFVGWVTYDGEIFDFSKRISNSLSLYAAVGTEETLAVVRKIESYCHNPENYRDEIKALEDEYSNLEHPEYVYNSALLESALNAIIALDFQFSMQWDGTYLITGYKGNDSVVHVPATYNGLQVKGIGASAFEFCTSIEVLYIPTDSMDTLGSYIASPNTYIFCQSLTPKNNWSAQWSSGCAGVYENYYDKSVENGLIYSAEGEYAVILGIISTVNINIPAKLAGKEVTQICLEIVATSGIESITSSNDNFVGQGNCLIEKATKTLVLGCNNSVIPVDGSVERIGARAFYGCSGLQSLEIPDVITFIDEGAFYGCSGLTSITIKSLDNLTDEIGGYFGYMFGAGSYSENGLFVPSSLKEVILNGATSIGENYFYGCNGIERITLPASLISIGDYAFSGCSLTEITIPENVTSIGFGAFENCTCLESIVIPFIGATYEGKTNTHFGYIFGAFSYSFNSNYVPTSIKEVVITNAKTIAGYAFAGCGYLEKVSIPDSVTSIDKFALSACNRLQEITLPYAAWGSGHFGYIFGADNYNFNSQYVPASLKKVTTTQSGNIVDYLFYQCSNITELVIPDGVTSIGNYAFYGCSKLNDFRIPATVTRIGNYAFYNCTGLTAMLIPDGVTSIGGYAFSNCTGLTAMLIPDGVTSIGSYAFSGCTNLINVSIPNTLTSFGDDIFRNCDALQYYEYENDLYLGNDANPYIVLIKLNNSNITEYTIKENTKFIYKDVFSGSRLTEITIPDSVLSIGENAFYNCTDLADITFSKNLTVIGQMAFNGCSKLKTVILPDSITSMGYASFGNCNSLETISIPFVGSRKSGTYSSYSSDGQFGYIFYGSALYDSDKIIPSTLKTVIITGGESIADRAFEKCTTIESISISSSTKTIGQLAFSGCTGLTSLIFENPNGWRYSNSSNGPWTVKDGLEDPTVAVEIFTGSYRSYYWKCI